MDTITVNPLPTDNEFFKWVCSWISEWMKYRLFPVPVLFIFINLLLFLLFLRILWSSAEPLVICLYIEKRRSFIMKNRVPLVRRPGDVTGALHFFKGLMMRTYRLWSVLSVPDWLRVTRSNFGRQTSSINHYTFWLNALCERTVFLAPPLCFCMAMKFKKWAKGERLRVEICCQSTGPLFWTSMGEFQKMSFIK